METTSIGDFALGFAIVAAIGIFLWKRYGNRTPGNRDGGGSGGTGRRQK